MKKTYEDNMIFGIRAIIETINSGKEIDKLFMQKGLQNDLIKELGKLCHQLHIPISKVPVEKLNRFTRNNHQGAVAFTSAVHYASLSNVVSTAFESGRTPLFVILDKVTDVRNFGAIARTAECAGINAIIIPSRGSAAVNSDAMKTSAGALNFIPVCREANLKNTITYLKESGIQVIACTEKTDNELYSAKFDIPTAILMGSEDEGISPEYLKMSDEKVRIPMSGNISSLNVSVAAGIVIYEAVRQRL